MTIPVVAARTTTADPSSTGVHAIALGAPNAGDLLVVFTGTSGIAPGPHIIDQATSGTRWAQIGAGVGVSQTRIAVFAKIADGGGADALTLLTPTTIRMGAICYRITGHGSTVSTGTTASANSTNGNPPAASISGAAQDVLFLTAMVTNSSVASAPPASYGTLTTISAGGGFVCVSGAERGIAATTSDDPGTFTNTSQEWIATTIAIPELAIATNARASQAVREALSITSPEMRASQVIREFVSATAPYMLATQVVVEMVSENVPDDTLSAQPVMLFIAT